MALAALILWAADQEPLKTKRSSTSAPDSLPRFLQDKVAAQAAEKLKALFEHSAPVEDKSLVYQVSLNRTATPALVKSVPAVKADAARTLFTVNCSDIVWAVIDSGIDARHDAFKTADGKACRIKRSFDFTKIRDIVSLDNLDPGTAQQRIKTLLRDDLRNPPTAAEAQAKLKQLAKDAGESRPIDWALVEELIEIKPATKPPTNHGTHVAGILAANKKPAERDGIECADGMCPDIFLYDFRVLAPSLTETEFAIIAALQYIRYINARNSYMTVHGANLSLSIKHDVRNYACGRTPICDECERLVNSGVVVVAAAGNRGYQNFETKEGLYEGYAAFSVTDPGNADDVITVGATHRFWPHTYGVSFFSSRGPTGDGRLKPDIVAPGERIRAPLRDNEWGELDGTSMAAPHVSGAAAMLMARYTELVGRPRRIKEIICNSATDLGRERSFQGHGMLDVLRAFQSI
jgi:subtilisin family serine protease